MHEPRGSYIGGRWVMPEGPRVLRSVNPATDGETVFETTWDPAHVGAAVASAAEAWPDWAAARPEDRVASLRRFARELQPRVEPLARAISDEMGKPLREARQEARSLVARIDLVAEQQLPRVAPWTVPGVDGECRYHPLGVIGVIGPFNFPLHLVHAHVIPALATGNTVVLKPSERAPLAAQRYVEAFAAAGLPPVLQLVQGGAEAGRALCAAPALRGLAFTGSWRTGHAIQAALHDRPEVLCALEMGGQNMAIVLDDADLDQALEGVLLGAFLTTGQRCTRTSRLLVQETVAEGFLARLVQAARRLTWGNPREDVFMGPMASVADRDHLDALCRAGVEAGGVPLLPGERRPGGAWRGPSIHRIAADHDSDYTREETFGPDLAVTVVRDLDEAIGVLNGSAYGLSAAIFSRRREAMERVYLSTRVGCVNWNRSTNRASGVFPFGGLGRSGNFRPAGADAVRYTTYPVQVLWSEAGVLEGEPLVRRAMAEGDPVGALERRHRFEELCEPYGVYPVLDGERARIPVAQLDRTAGPALAEALVRELAARRVAAELAGAVVEIAVPAGDTGARRTAEALSDALHALRPLHPARFLARREEGAHVPAGEGLALPRSRALLDRLVAGGLVPDDKKPPVLDVFRSSGPYLASVDDDALVLLDAAGQIATHAGGLNPPEILEALWTGAFKRTPVANPDTRTWGHPALSRLASLLRAHVGHGVSHVAFCGSGSEANELALRMAARHRPGRRALIAFEGSFHGRTLAVLHATWNPSKRARFELEGFQARWCPWPVWDHATPEPPAAADDLDGWDERLGVDARRPPAGDDPLLAAEHAALLAVEAALADDRVAAVLTEPMQSEGGERHVTGRFFVRLRALAQAYDVPFIVDEVQTGLGLGGPFFWHRRFPLATPPDLVTVAKKAQVGAVLSRWPFDSRGEANLASVIRGTLQAEIMMAGDAEAAEALVRPRLAELAARHPATVLAPRATGFAFGFDLPDAAAVGHLVEQRLWRGWMLYGAGDRGVRFRLHPHVTVHALDAMFARLDRSLALLESGGAPAWRAEPLPDPAPAWPPAPARCADGYEILAVRPEDWDRVHPAVARLQAVCYEPARRDALDDFGGRLAEPGAIFLVAVHGHALPPDAPLVGTALAFPLEHVADLDGPAQDPLLGTGTVLYSADVTVHPEHRGLGLGAALKEAQIRAAILARRPDGTPRYRYLTGRNKVGATAAMQHINLRFGGWPVARYADQYGTGGATVYYRIPLTAPRLPEAVAPEAVPADGPLDLDGGLALRLGPLNRGAPGVDEVLEPTRRGALNGALVNKLSLCNFVTPGVVRAAELLRVLAPRRMGHLVLASSRAETCDKGLRAAKFHRPAARVAIALGPVDTGETTAAARSLALPGDHPENFFRWPSTADPTVDWKAALEDLRRLLGQHGGDAVLAVVAEAVYGRTGRAMPDAAWLPLRKLTREHGVPLVLAEHASGFFRSGRGAWRADTLPIEVDAVWAYAGGQVGLCFLSEAMNVPDKLTLISTWDGDEVGLIRLAWELRAARRLPVADTARRLEEVLSALGPVRGEGLYRSVEVPAAARVRERLLERGVMVGLTECGTLRVAPPLNLDEAGLARISTAVRAIRAD